MAKSAPPWQDFGWQVLWNPVSHACRRPPKKCGNSSALRLPPSLALTREAVLYNFREVLITVSAACQKRSL